MSIIINGTAVPSAVPGVPAQLTCEYASLVNEVGFQHSGLRPTSADVITDGVASAAEATDILRCISKGLQFLYSAYRWSFLRPLVPITTHPAYSTGTITVTALGAVTGIGTVFPTYSFSAGGWLAIPSVGSFAVASYVSGVALTLTGYDAAAVTVASIFSLGFNAYPLPAGVDSLEGRLTYPQGDYQPREFLEKKSEVEIRRLLALSITPGRPRIYAETMNTFDPTAGSSRYVTLYPVPDDQYTLTAVGTLRPSMIDRVNKYPLGIEVLAPCIVESCLAVIERDFDGNTNGPHAQALQPLLAMAIQRDKEYASPDTLGVDHGQEGEEQYHQRRSGGINWNAGGGISGII